MALEPYGVEFLDVVLMSWFLAFFCQGKGPYGLISCANSAPVYCGQNETRRILEFWRFTTAQSPVVIFKNGDFMGGRGGVCGKCIPLGNFRIFCDWLRSVRFSVFWAIF